MSVVYKLDFQLIGSGHSLGGNLLCFFFFFFTALLHLKLERNNQQASKTPDALTHC